MGKQKLTNNFSKLDGNIIFLIYIKTYYWAPLSYGTPKNREAVGGISAEEITLLLNKKTGNKATVLQKVTCLQDDWNAFF